MRYLSVASPFKDEGPYLVEWIEFHLSQGVEHFYLYNHNSSDDGPSTIQRYVDAGVVTLIHWDRDSKHGVVKHCIENFKNDSHWIAFIDLDEFLYSTEGLLPKLLTEYEPYPALFVHWLCFGSSRHIQKPAGGILPNFLWRADEKWLRNGQGKSIVNPREVDTSKTRTVHRMSYFSGARDVDEDMRFPDDGVGVAARISRLLFKSGHDTLWSRLAKRIALWMPLLIDPYSGHHTRITHRRIRINHYIVKSEEEYFGKMKRMSRRPAKYNMVFFKYHDRNEVRDDRFAPPHSDSKGLS
jgi:hypothetical protein